MSLLVERTMRWLVALLVFAFVTAATAEPNADLVRVSKRERQLEIISGGKVIHEFKVGLGGTPIGHKSKEGDGIKPIAQSFALDDFDCQCEIIKIRRPRKPNKLTTRPAISSDSG